MKVTILNESEKLTSYPGGVLLSDTEESDYKCARFYQDDLASKQSRIPSEILIEMVSGIPATLRSDRQKVNLFMVRCSINGLRREQFIGYYPQERPARMAFHNLRNECIDGFNKTGDFKKTISRLERELNSMEMPSDMKMALDDIGDYYGDDVIVKNY